MVKELNLNFASDPFKNSIEPAREIAAYEVLWSDKSATVKRISDLLKRYSECKPSDLVKEEDLKNARNKLLHFHFNKDESLRPKILIKGTADYPEPLNDAKNPIQVLYYVGDTCLLQTNSVAVVGSRKPSEEGKMRTRKLVKNLVDDGVTIVSGLAEGVDTEAHTTAIKQGGKTIAVIGTPINKFYPRQNEQLQKHIAKEHLLISQVPYLRYSTQDYRMNRGFFPERNKTMSALTKATVIVEASETSGTLIQARAALYQGRTLFILNSCFENPKITWPDRFLKQGAIRVRDYNDIKEVLNSGTKTTKD